MPLNCVSAGHRLRTMGIFIGSDTEAHASCMYVHKCVCHACLRQQVRCNGILTRPWKANTVHYLVQFSLVHPFHALRPVLGCGQARHPFLDELVQDALLRTPLPLLANLALPPGVGDKRVLREALRSLHLPRAAARPKRVRLHGHVSALHPLCLCLPKRPERCRNPESRPVWSSKLCHHVNPGPLLADPIAECAM